MLSYKKWSTEASNLTFQAIRINGASATPVAQMGWERRGKHEYYYRKERDGSRVKSVYVGRGEIAKMVSGLQATSVLFEKAIGIAYPSEQQQLKDQDATIEHACRLIDAITRASLLSAGFHTHKRQWRRRRYGNSGKESGRTGGSDSDDTS